MSLDLQHDTANEGRVRKSAIAPHIVYANAVYGTEELRQALGLKRSTLRREVRLGRLRVLKRGGKHFFLGEHVLNWLRDGEVSRKQKTGNAALTGAAASL
jgi:hypothetical protein